MENLVTVIQASYYTTPNGCSLWITETDLVLTRPGFGLGDTRVVGSTKILDGETRIPTHEHKDGFSYADGSPVQKWANEYETLKIEDLKFVGDTTLVTHPMSERESKGMVHAAQFSGLPLSDLSEEERDSWQNYARECQEEEQSLSDELPHPAEWTYYLRRGKIW